MRRSPKSTTRRRRIADRLATARRTGFVGRGEELVFFRSILSAHPPPFAVLHVHGPGGVGKSTLLREFARIARDAGRPVVMLDGRDIQPSRAALIRALGEAIGSADATEVSAATIPDGAVVLIDTYESLAPLDRFLRETLLPAWPSHVLVVLAGRDAPAVPWTTDVDWARMTRVLPLANFAPAESRAFLQARGVEPAAHSRVLDFTRGHPLALALVSDVLAGRRRQAQFDPLEAPDVVRHLSKLFIDTVPDERQGEALVACAVARVTGLPLLVELFGRAAGEAAFEWLRRQSFVESGPRGLFPHDLVREVLLAEARWRDAAALMRLSRRLYTALYAQIAAARGPERQRLQMDALYVTRTKPTNTSFFDWRALDEVRVEPAEAGDERWILDLVRRHEGSASAELAAAWWRLQPSAFHVFRGREDAAFGFLALLDLAEAGASGSTDPAVAAARVFMERHGPVRRGDGVVYLRWWMHADAYQAVTAAINLTAMHVVSHCVTRPGMAWNFVVMADPSFWAAHFDGVNFPRVREADFEVGGRRYGVFAHDWRIEPPADWLMGARVPMPFAAAGDPGPAAPSPSQADFERAVRRALRDYTRPEMLAAGSLRSCRLARDASDGPARGAKLQALLRAAADELQAHPRDRKLHRALWYTYFEPLPSQEQAAERLGLPFSTYRHHLARGVARVALWLWSRERALPPA